MQVSTSTGSPCAAAPCSSHHHGDATPLTLPVTLVAYTHPYTSHLQGLSRGVARLCGDLAVRCCRCAVGAYPQTSSGSPAACSAGMHADAKVLRMLFVIGGTRCLGRCTRDDNTKHRHKQAQFVSLPLLCRLECDCGAPQYKREGQACTVWLRGRDMQPCPCHSRDRV